MTLVTMIAGFFCSSVCYSNFDCLLTRCCYLFKGNVFIHFGNPRFLMADIILQEAKRVSAPNIFYPLESR
jgi:hypothetical protein